MARVHRVALYASIATSLYLLVLFQLISVPLVDTEIVEQLLPVLPWWLLVSFGSYSLWSLGWGLFTFRDCPEAYTELLGEISQAKNYLRAKGVTVD
ncbi:dolichol-phosphate mannosyltransferase subunit 3 [Macrolepiota fuliginosa MF-IS2]|uniref:Dolichol-phosphate mannosyltransferase subunit 3 n=1 Tax=Macrolepiota fuliginosa MF-IS2 TaxID=1400762 RepID=A0A9P5XAP1_9AGAR|nr:dolichol-phosphate mannosyltransferase subunit 3 [Macrolepiota fuliginosa MF-IS2]